MDRNEFQKAYGTLVAKAWEDASFKAELLADPMKALKDNGIEVPEGIKVRMVENTPDTVHFILPLQPSDELSYDVWLHWWWTNFVRLEKA